MNRNHVTVIDYNYFIKNEYNMVKSSVVYVINMGCYTSKKKRMELKELQEKLAYEKELKKIRTMIVHALIDISTSITITKVYNSLLLYKSIKR